MAARHPAIYMPSISCRDMLRKTILIKGRTCGLLDQCPFLSILPPELFLQIFYHVSHGRWASSISVQGWPAAVERDREAGLAIGNSLSPVCWLVQSGLCRVGGTCCCENAKARPLFHDRSGSPFSHQCSAIVNCVGETSKFNAKLREVATCSRPSSPP